MDYCSLSDVCLLAPAILQSEDVAARISDAIAVAGAKIDGRLEGKYDVPFTVGPPSLIATVAKLLAAGWAIKGAFSGSPESTQYAFGADCERQGMDILSELISGKMKLENAYGAAIPSQSAPICVSTMTPQLGNVDVLGHWGPKIPGAHHPVDRGPGPVYGWFGGWPG